MMKQTAARFEAVEKILRKKPWFKKQGWLASVHGFPKAKPEFVTFHLFKEHWHNGDGRGIHLESYLAIPPKKLKETYLTIHVLHHPKIPGTKLSRKAIAVPFVDSIYTEVKSWKGYKFRAGKYGMQPFSFFLDPAAPDFEDTLAKEIERLCQVAGPAMDITLAAIK